MASSINLIYLSGNTTGGWVTYTAHLVYGLLSHAQRVRLFKVRQRTERKERSFGYGLNYRNISLGSLEHIEGPKVIVALQKNFRTEATELLNNGAWMVVHDPAEFANLKLANCDRYITIRRAVQAQVSGSVFIPHPYRRTFRPGMLSISAKRPWHACSIARIDFDKHTDIMLDANRLLPENRRIRIHGFENRLYTRFKICPKYPEWEQSVCHYDRNATEAVNICSKHLLAVDMSVIKGDGGGTQYSFLEAMDAGCVNIINDKWYLEGDEMEPGFTTKGRNCVSVSTGEELAEILDLAWSEKMRAGYIKNTDKLLTRHDSSVVAKQYIKLLRS